MTEFSRNVDIAPGEFGERGYGFSFFLELPELLSPDGRTGEEFWREIRQKAEREGMMLGFGTVSGKMKRPNDDKKWNLDQRKVVLLSGGDRAPNFFSSLRSAMHNKVRLLGR